MTHFTKLATSLTAVTLASAAAAQDLSSLSAVDVLKLQVGAGQTAEQLEEQLADQLTFNADDEFINRSQVKNYALQLSAQGMAASGLSGSLPIRELTYDFGLKTYKICLPSSILYKSDTDGGTAEALVSIRFDGLAEKHSFIRSAGLNRESINRSVTDQGLDGIFSYVGKEEIAFRKNPLGGVSKSLGDLF